MSGIFRHGIGYAELLQKFERALEDVWPRAFLDDECDKISTKPEHLEQLMLTSYRLLKYIRVWLKRKRIDYTEGHKLPILSGAIENVVNIISVQKHCTLAVEASALEQVSRACYAFMKHYRMLKTSKKLHRCQFCKVNYAPDGLCDECSGANDLIVIKDGHPVPGGDMIMTTRSPLQSVLNTVR